MITAETYIKMRIAAIPDLGRGTPYLETFCTQPDLRTFVDRAGNFYVWTSGEPNWCQLEKQDQLQEMVDTIGNYRVGKLVQDLHKFLFAKTQSVSFTSMEQLWLAFCMSEKYGKIWSGTEWIKK